ncbi:hypothetical protein DNK06_06440 [Pseudomonas daroniae]|uniref:Uncharacterized protein n=1 Tax=Phytopseudomonas daroniae TaxID=2487519 RepID=A0A4Q9QQY9_9GAMM|nr:MULTISPECIES: hypothetical protein [Pseudomonas]TBU82147.1 hypothetical protein DNK06_06440 [Pseudomonas daroniae]TBU84517.1 hypothetical protein DNK31_06075 [Pseudomonas sp. FRB 228]TBU92448.1 hypothetical protein DNJ99_08585 [Pseudomonas daroniae]
MDIRFLTFPEFHRVYFYRSITLTILAAIGGLILIKGPDTPLPDLLLAGAFLFIMVWRFAVEWRRLKKSGPASIHNDELFISSAAGHRQIPLAKIGSVRSKHSIFMVRRYRSWVEHLAFVEFTLNTGERLYTLVESAVFEFPAGKKTLATLQAAVLAAKIKST